MSIDEKVCRALIAKGKWSKVNCQLCRKIQRGKCKVLQEAQQENKEVN